SSHEFLSGIAGFFGLTASAGVRDDRTDLQLKESIKSFLFAKGVEEGKIVVLLIDEGQKLPDFCLEILREFLNYETNDSKLLQIVIFAQQEFRERIDRLANLSNRINLLYSLKPLGFRDTGRIVAYRIDQSSEDGAVRPMFTWPGLLALYMETGGNPRSINMLCHHVVLSLIPEPCEGRVVSRESLRWQTHQQPLQQARPYAVGVHGTGTRADTVAPASCIYLLWSIIENGLIYKRTVSYSPGRSARLRFKASRCRR
ncbi:MAG TPA: AAA family ATPase, partial [Dissulfurispiraceae bacterium]|nr:AAA family ATPase [Dissulfurispiraceae bacterium]